MAVALLLALFAIVALASARVHSGVPDEVAVHVPAGFLFLETGVFAGGLANPPLGQLLVALPAWLGAGDYVPFESQGLFAPRVVVIAIGLLAALVLLRFARGLVAPGAALGALLLLATSPSFVAHASLATLDVPISAAILVAVALARRCAISGGRGDYAMLGAALGVACSVKVQGLAAIPLVAAQIALAPAPAWRSPGGVGRTASGLAIGAFVGWMIVHGAYGFAGIAAGEWLPAAFIDATLTKFLHGTSGHTSYLMGQLSTSGSLLYFPVALLVKTPVPLLVSAAIGIVAVAQSRELAVWLGLPMLLFFGMAAVSSVNIGIRHLLPFLPFFFVAGGIGLVRIGRTSRIALAAICLLQLGQVLWVAPHGLAYFNVLGGGTANGYRLLLDSNFDWGQHDDQLRAHLEGVDEVEISPDPLAPRLGRVIVGASVLHGILGPPHAYAWLREHEPVARIASTWFEYRLSETDIAGAPKIAAPRELRVRDDLVAHVLAAARDARVEDDPRAELAVARACWELFEYGCTLDHSRRVSLTSPGYRGAFWLASELTARRRLGALRFEGRELLDGFERVDAADSLLSVDRLGSAVRRLEPFGVRAQVSNLHAVLGDLHWSRAEWSSALANLRRSHALDPEDFAVWFKLGWLLATHPDASERDGEFALRLALAHGEKAGWRVAVAHDLHAAALAELGRYEEAATASRRALELSTAPGMRAELQTRLDGYTAGRPYRQRRPEKPRN